MPESRWNLLVEPLVGVRQGQRRAELSLPDVLAQLSDGRPLEFTALQPHQEHAWHAFLVQLATIALHEAGDPEPPTEAGRWRTLLRSLAGGQDEPWSLTAEDLSLPAFMQPPVPEGTVEGFKRIATPDLLDVLVTSTNHDVKMGRIVSPDPQHWIFALVSLQTMEGFMGRGNYGIARMNSGFGSRPCAALVPSMEWGKRFVRDLAVLRDSRAGIVSAHGYRESAGKTLLWLEPWDGSDALSLAECDPFFIEICRRVRLFLAGERIVACGRATEGPRIESTDIKGNTGDPWTPVNRMTGKALTVSSRGFSYRKTQELLFGADYAPGAALRPRAERDGGSVFVGSALARGQGKTNGFKTRLLPVPGKVALALGRSGERERIASLARRRVDAVDRIRTRVLKPALCALLQAAPEKLNYKDDRPGPWLRSHDQKVDAMFFLHLWDSLDRDPSKADRSWERTVLDMARQELESAIASAPLPSIHRYRAIAKAEAVFAGSARKQCPGVFEEDTNDE